MRRRPPRQHQLRQDLEHVGRVQSALHHDRQGLAGELVDHAQHPELATVVRAMLDEVIGPDVVRPLRPQPDAGSVVQPEPTPLRLSCRRLQPLPPPDPLDPLGIRHPARLAQERGDPPVAVAAAGRRQRDDVCGQPLFVLGRAQDAALGRSRLARHPAGAALGDVERRAHLPDRFATAGGADCFPRRPS